VLKAARLSRRRGGIENAFPIQVAPPYAQSKWNQLIMGVQQDCEGIADNAFTPLVSFGDLISWEDHTNAPDVRSIPIRIGHLSAIGFEPVEIFDFRPVDGAALKKMSPPEDRLGFSQVQHLTREVEQSALFVGELPIEPCDRRILAISIVVSMLRLSKFVTG
jgi:hypothetical protein